MTLTPFRRVAALVAGVAAVLLLGLLTHLTTLRNRDAVGLVGHTYEVLTALEVVQGRTVDAETGVRGFVSTGEARFLEPYAGAEHDARRELARLRRLTADNAAQQPRLDTLDRRLSLVFADLDSMVDLRGTRALAPTEAAVLLATGKARMDALRTAAAAAGSAERELLARREAEEERLRTVTAWAVFGETLAAASCVLIVGLLLAAAARAERRHANAAETARTDAESTARLLQQQTAELEAANQQLQEQAVELEGTTEALQATAADLAVRTATAETARIAAERANRTRADFLASMSHELRTPLNAIQGYVQLLELGLYGPVPEEQRATLERIHRAQRHLLALVNDILNFTKLEAGQVRFDVQPVRVSTVMADVVPLLEPQIRAKGLALVVSLPDEEATGPVLAWADRDKLAQILVNLLANAVKFTPATRADGTEGRITLALTDRAEVPDAVFVRVHDTGIGIPRDKQDAIFEPFVQVSTGLTRTSEGTGLGLAISRDLARGMRGDLRVRSVDGDGSTFTVTLRRVSDADGPGGPGSDVPGANSPETDGGDVSFAPHGS